jgi:hypothetical protein
MPQTALQANNTYFSISSLGGYWAFSYLLPVGTPWSTHLHREGVTRDHGKRGLLKPQSTQSAGPVRFLILCSISISLLASLVAGRGELGHRCRECTPPYLSTGISNLPQSAQTKVVLGHPPTFTASWAETIYHRSPFKGRCVHPLHPR